MAGKLIMTKGLPASGKTTWANEQSHKHRGGLVVVCKDNIRAELFQKDWNYDKEKEVLRVRDFRISQALSAGKIVISADTNLAPKHEATLRAIAKKYRVPFEIQSFLDVPLAECIRRDRNRDDSVGEKVIVKMAEELLTPSELIVRTADEGKPQFFCDLDGVLADFDGFIEENLGIVNNKENEDPDFWDKARAYKGRLYYDMPHLPTAKELWEGLRPFKPIILTGCPWSIPTAADDKRQWVSEHFGHMVPVICCKSRNKCLYAKPGDVLLDDWTKYKERWEAMGGIFVHYTGDNQASLKVLKELLNG